MTTLLLTSTKKMNSFIFYLGMICIGCFVFLKCDKDADEPKFTKMSKMGLPIDLSRWSDASAATRGNFFLIDTTKPISSADSLKRQNDFIKHFNDTATLIQFQRWLYKSVSAENYNNVLNTISPYFNEYAKQKLLEATRNRPKENF